MFDDETIEFLAESVYEIHRQTVRHAGFDLTDIVSDKRRNDMIGVIASILSPSFTPVFGQFPIERYEDVFEQVSDFAEHLAKRHVFADGNKRTTMQVTVGLLETSGLTINVPDSPDPDTNAMYRWIQDVVTGDRTTGELSAFLRAHARPINGSMMLI